jgi:DNA-binding NarL/FixJ family response regulator
MDIGGEDIGGLSLAFEIKNLGVGTQSLLMTDEDGTLVVDAFRSGAIGSFARSRVTANTRLGSPDSTARFIADLIHQAARGSIVATDRDLAFLVEAVRQSKPLKNLDVLTKTENRVLALVAEGYSNLNIAANLGVSEHAVRMRLSKMFAKLNVSTRTQLAILALQAEPSDVSRVGRKS